MNFKPYPYQQHCIEQLVESSIKGLFLDMGLG